MSARICRKLMNFINRNEIIGGNVIIRKLDQIDSQPAMLTEDMMEDLQAPNEMSRDDAFGTEQDLQSAPVSVNTSEDENDIGEIWNQAERKRRGEPTLKLSTVKMLKRWLFRHRSKPYPTAREKEVLSRRGKISKSKISKWFISARQRILQDLKSVEGGNPSPFTSRRGLREYLAKLRM